MKQVADESMVKNALGESYDSEAEPPNLEAPRNHKLWPLIHAALKEIYDPEIPVNIYELGLIYAVEIHDDEKAGISDIDVKMSLTSPHCPVAQEMPGWVESGLFSLDGVGEVKVEIVWEPTWDPSFMAETAKIQLNMFV